MTDNQQPNMTTELADVQATIFNNTDCPSCRDRDVNKSQPPCGHAFCHQCLNDWFKLKLKCPTCKELFTTFIDNLLSDSESDESTDYLDDFDDLSSADGSFNEEYESLFEKFENLLENKYEELNHYLSQQNNPAAAEEPDNSPEFHEMVTILNDFGSLFRNFNGTRRRLATWQLGTPDLPLISAFFTDNELAEMEDSRPGSGQFLCQLFSHLALQQ